MAAGGGGAADVGARSAGRAADGVEDLLFDVTGSSEVARSFEDMGLKEELLKGVYAYGAYGGRAVVGMSV
jgi:hypothetical protein